MLWIKNIIEQIFELSCYLAAIKMFSRLELNNVKKKSIVSLCLIVIIEISLKSSILMEYEVVIWTLFQLVTIYWFINDSKRNRILGSITSFFIVGVVDVIIALLFELLWDINYKPFDYTWLVLLALEIVVYLLIKIFKVSFKLRETSIYIWAMVIGSAFVVSGFLMCNYMYRQNPYGIKENAITFFNILAALFYLVIVIVLMLTNSALIQIRNKNEIEKKYEDLKRDYYEEILKNTKDIRTFKHDINCHFLCLYEMLDENRYSDAKKYLVELDEKVSNIGKKRYNTGNVIVDSIINQMYFKAKEENIIFEFQYKVYGQLMISEVDFSTIIYNLLQNAIEACKNVEEKNREINVLIKQHNDNLFINICNSVEKNYDSNRLTGFITTKSDKLMHGLGLYSVNTIIEKYKNDIVYEVIGDRVCINIVLYKVIFNKTS